MNKDFLREVALSAGCGEETLAVIEKITLARELWTLLTAEDLQAFLLPFARTVPSIL